MNRQLHTNKTLDDFLLVRYIRDIEKDMDLHKWYQSEKVGHDIGRMRAIVDWNIRVARKYFTTHPLDRYLKAS